jgi:hypothetical protein
LSTETALQQAITHVEEAVENWKVTLGAFLHIEGALDSTSFDIITGCQTAWARRHDLSMLQVHAAWQENDGHTRTRVKVQWTAGNNVLRHLKRHLRALL